MKGHTGQMGATCGSVGPPGTDDTGAVLKAQASIIPEGSEGKNAPEISGGHRPSGEGRPLGWGTGTRGEGRPLGWGTGTRGEGRPPGVGASSDEGVWGGDGGLWGLQGVGVT